MARFSYSLEGAEGWLRPVQTSVRGYPQGQLHLAKTNCLERSHHWDKGNSLLQALDQTCKVNNVSKTCVPTLTQFLIYHHGYNPCWRI